MVRRRRRWQGRERMSERKRLEEVAIMCKEKVMSLPKGERIKAWRRCINQALRG